MSANSLVLLILTPFVLLFAYAAWHEWHRARNEGHSNYGLAYDPETETTHVTLLDEGETGYNPETDSPEGEAESDDTKG